MSPSAPNNLRHLKLKKFLCKKMNNLVGVKIFYNMILGSFDLYLYTDLSGNLISKRDQDLAAEVIQEFSMQYFNFLIHRIWFYTPLEFILITENLPYSWVEV